MSKPAWLSRREITKLTPTELERAVLFGTIILALTGSFTDQDRKSGSVIALRQGINKMNRRTVKGKKVLAKKLSSMTIQAWEVSFKLDPTVRTYSAPYLMGVIWTKHKGILAYLYGANVERHLDSVVNKFHDINDDKYSAVELETVKVADNVTNAVNKVLYDRRAG